MAVFLILGLILFLLVVAYIRFLSGSDEKTRPSSIGYDLDKHKVVNKTKYSRTRKPIDFDLVADRDKIGDPAYPNAQRDAVAKEWDEYRKMRNAPLDPLDDDRSKWIYPDI